MEASEIKQGETYRSASGLMYHVRRLQDRKVYWERHCDEANYVDVGNGETSVSRFASRMRFRVEPNHP